MRLGKNEMHITRDEEEKREKIVLHHYIFFQPLTIFPSSLTHFILDQLLKRREKKAKVG